MFWTGLCIGLMALSGIQQGADAEITDTSLVDIPLQTNESMRVNITAWPLHHAARTGDVKAISSFVNKGADVYQRDTLGLTPMHHAIIVGKDESILALVKNGFDVNVRLDGNSTVLYFALQQGKDEVVRRLLEIGADVNVKLPNGNTYLHRAVDENDFIVALRLLKIGINVAIENDLNEKALDIAVKQDKPVFINLFTTNGASVISDKYLNQALMTGRRKTLRNQLSRGGVWRQRRDELLRKAVEYDDVASAEVLVDFGADLHQRFRSDSLSLLHWAGDRGSIKIIPWLVSRGLDVNVTDGSKWNAVHQAAYQGNVLSIKELLDLGCCINCKNRDGNTPVQVAEKYKHSQVIEYLRSRGG